MNIKKVLPYLAALLATFFGAMAVISGGRVLLGISVPDQVIHTWLVAYNVLAGAVSLTAALGMVLGKSWAETLAKVILGAHLLVFAIVLVMMLTSGNVATKSVVVMAVRAVVWALIVGALRFAKTSSSDSGSGTQ